MRSACSWDLPQVPESDLSARPLHLRYRDLQLGLHELGEVGQLKPTSLELLEAPRPNFLQVPLILLVTSKSVDVADSGESLPFVAALLPEHPVS